MNLLITVPKEFSNGVALKQVLEGACLYKKPSLVRITNSNVFLEEGIKVAILNEDENISFTHYITILNSCKQIPKNTVNTETSKFYKSSLTYTTNIKDNHEYDLYIGRGSIYGNPYSRRDGFTKEECIHNHSYDFCREILPNIQQIKTDLDNKKGIRLGCFCSPKSCHGDIYTWYCNKTSPIMPLN
ncbi:DUF4326 domain-containing protein [Vibrio sp. D431a]|uniref:DUF4326 domain-containing protein n=1 Tax=Vibrio sp. D431a TaxID=2837388 RepID=UPI002556078B|nr:DUF4326 domain-containing protein [Vibrio sp. D431a]MDK9793807.1 DUF4326 domain-containing protein [Vibrio sp. D431a]